MGCGCKMMESGGDEVEFGRNELGKRLEICIGTFFSKKNLVYSHMK